MRLAKLREEVEVAWNRGSRSGCKAIKPATMPLQCCPNIRPQKGAP